MKGFCGWTKCHRIWGTAPEMMLNGWHVARGAWLLLIGLVLRRDCTTVISGEGVSVSLCATDFKSTSALCVSRGFCLSLVAPLPKCSTTWKPRAGAQQDERVPSLFPLLKCWVDILMRGIPELGTHTAAYVDRPGHTTQQAKARVLLHLCRRIAFSEHWRWSLSTQVALQEWNRLIHQYQPRIVGGTHNMSSVKTIVSLIGVWCARGVTFLPKRKWKEAEERNYVCCNWVNILYFPKYGWDLHRGLCSNC